MGASVLLLPDHAVNPAFHVKVVLFDFVQFAIEDHLEATDGVFDRNVLPGNPGEHFRNMEGLGKELLNFTGPKDHLFLLGRKLVQSEDRNDVLQILVGLQDLLNPTGDLEVFFAYDIRRKSVRNR